MVGLTLLNKKEWRVETTFGITIRYPNLESDLAIVKPCKSLDCNFFIVQTDDRQTDRTNCLTLPHMHGVKMENRIGDILSTTLFHPWPISDFSPSKARNVAYGLYYG